MSVSVTTPSLSELRSMARPSVYDVSDEKWFASRRWNLISNPLYSREPPLRSAPTVDRPGALPKKGRLMFGLVTPTKGGAWLRSVLSAMFRPCDPEYATSSMRLAPTWRWRLTLKLCACPSRKFTSNDDRVAP